MISKTLGLLWLAAALIVTAALSGIAAFAQKPTPTSAPTPRTHLQIPATPGPGKIAIYIVNDYDVDMNLGPLGNGHRNGIDEISGILTRQGNGYVGTVDASVDSNQKMLSSLGGGCGGQYHDVQKLKVTAREVHSFSNLIQSVDWTQSTGRVGTEYLMLELTPETKSATQPARFNEVTNQLSVKCHDLIIPQGDDSDEDEDRSSTQPPPGFDPGRFDGIAFLPLNDTRWTTRGQGYIVRLPASGTLKYKDIHPPGPAVTFRLNKSEWSIHIVRVP